MKPEEENKLEQTAITSTTVPETPVSISTTTQEPVDLSAKTEAAKSSSESQGNCEMTVKIDVL